MVSLVGLDLGGNWIKAVLSEDDGERHSLSRATGDHADPNKILDVCAELVRELQANAVSKVNALGFGLPGQVDAAAGVFLASPAILPTWKQVPVQSGMENRLGIPVAVDNDANLALRGEHRFGCAQGETEVILLTLGTGVGGAMMMDGALRRGFRGGFGEFGHLRPARPEMEAIFGVHYILGEVASISGLLRLFEHYADEPVSELQAFLIQRQKQIPAAIQAFEHFALAVADALEIAACVCAPRLAVLGGGLADAFGPDLIAAVEARRIRNFPLAIRDMELRLAELGNSAGALGAVDAAEALLAAEMVR